MAVAAWFAAALRVAGSTPTEHIYLYGLQVVVPGLAIGVCDFSMFVVVSGIIPSVRHFFFKLHNSGNVPRA